MNQMLKRAIGIALCAVMTFLCACKKDGKQNMTQLPDANQFTIASLSGADRLGREITPTDGDKKDRKRYVGVFYFLWLGTHVTSAGVYDSTKLLATENGAKAILDPSYRLGQKIPGTANAEAGYPDGMESPANYVHWTSEPLYGYYNTADEWVITRHMELLTLAGVDFIYLDVTNNKIYEKNYHTAFSSDPTDPKNVALSRPTYTLLDTILKLYNQGWNVPKVVFYTNTQSGDRVNEIYDCFYRDGKYEDIWFRPTGKPLIVGTTKNNKGTDAQGTARVNISDEMCDYFDVRESQWPNQTPADNGFPWMDWTNGDNYYYSENKVVNVSVAQHGANETSYAAYTYMKNRYGDDISKYRLDGRSSKGWNESELIVEKNWQAGRNIEDQWETVFRYEAAGKEVEMVTVTGWNEWLAWKYCPGGSDHPLFVDNFSNEFSRDMEMDKNTYQDNFYLQLVRNVRRYKGAAKASDYEWKKKTVNSFSDFAGVASKYYDFRGDAIERDFYGFDIRPGSKEQGLLGSWYTDRSARNDVVSVAVTHDDENVYFGIETVEAITAYESGENWMNVLLSTKKADAGNSWEGYDYILNRAPGNGKTSVEKSAGGWNWEKVGEATMTVDGNKMTISVPLSMLGLSASEFSFGFKVADNVTNYKDIMDYYVSGDSAPIGRLRYSYGY